MIAYPLQRKPFKAVECLLLVVILLVEPFQLVVRAVQRPLLVKVHLKIDQFEYGAFDAFNGLTDPKDVKDHLLSSDFDGTLKVSRSFVEGPAISSWAKNTTMGNAHVRDLVLIFRNEESGLPVTRIKLARCKPISLTLADRSDLGSYNEEVTFTAQSVELLDEAKVSED